ncbi:hypothetical protein M407DRAFT_24211 [Tulasnella calospora MUT 4182]|uniref:F-box domain-containing protein n=1 Tax=Tulasnella calospora MUT 4182 TaxID=1051891 RepID=A0A0C3Q960_9AGAM|nr:hypothetical protein M407DRAFT_24211 [Tulasnella calospora MUT 4182]
MSQLPTELVVKIFEFALPSADLTLYGVSYVRTLYAIRLIAKRWQEIVDGTPTFWKFVISILPPHVNEATLSRSGNSPLTVIYSTERSDIGHDHPSAQDFVDSLAHTFHRWSAYNGPVVSGYFDKQAPHLRAIVLWQGETYIPVLELLGGNATNLRHVALSDMSVRWRTGLFARLKVLELRCVSDTNHKLTATHLLDALRASPGLEHLDLDCGSVTIDHPPSLPIITLPRLRYIHFVNCTNGFAGAILRQIRAPSCTYLSLDFEEEQSLPIFLNEDFGPLEELLRTIHSRNGSSGITFDSGSYFSWDSPAEGVRPVPTFSVYMLSGAKIPCISWVERILQDGPGFSICFDDDSAVDLEVLESMESMRCITRVEIRDVWVVEKYLLVLKFIGEPLSTDPVSPSLPCLRELLLTGTEWTTQSVLDMVRSRFSSPLWESTERTPLTISIPRGAFEYEGSEIRPIRDVITLSRIRETDGVECVRFVGSEELDGTLAIIWDEKTSAPVWG